MTEASETMENAGIELIELKNQMEYDRNNYDLGEKSARKFYYYTREITAKSILNGDNNGQLCFWINPLSKMNDGNEIEMHKEENTKIFALCFSNEESESIPMWYLYSGITGEGVRIGLTSLKMKILIDGISCVYPVINNKPDFTNQLIKDRDFTVSSGWVSYVGRIKYRYRNESIIFEHQICDEEIQRFYRDNYFVKDYEWNYEKEFRIVFDFRKSTVPIPGKIALLVCKEQLMAKGGGLSLQLAPELKGHDFGKVSKQYALPEKKITKSHLNVSMKLIDRNKSVIINNFREVIENAEAKDLESMEDAIRCYRTQ